MTEMRDKRISEIACEYQPRGQKESEDAKAMEAEQANQAQTVKLLLYTKPHSYSRMK
jgi:hypothetical protein